MSEKYCVVTLDGQEHGGLDLVTVQQWYWKRQLREDSFVRAEDSAEWKLLRNTFDLVAWASTARAGNAAPTQQLPQSEQGRNSPGGSWNALGAATPPIMSAPTAAYTFQPSAPPQPLAPQPGYQGQVNRYQPQPGGWAPPPLATGQYRSGLGLARATIAGLAACTILSPIILFLSMATGMAEGRPVRPDEVFAPAMIIFWLVGFVGFGCYIFAAIMFILNLYRANANVRALGRQPGFTNGWTVGCWFIPVASLFIPYQIIKDIWVKSDPNEFADESSFMVGAYWTMWVITIVLGAVGFYVGFQAGMTHVPNPTATFAINVAQTITYVMAGVLAINVVSSIQKRQNERSKTARPQLVGYGVPAPPVF